MKRTITSAHRSCRVEPSSLNSHASHSSIQANSINSAISTDEGARETSWTIRFGCCCSAQLNRRDDVNFQRESFDMSYTITLNGLELTLAEVEYRLVHINPDYNGSIGVVRSQSLHKCSLIRCHLATGFEKTFMADAIFAFEFQLTAQVYRFDRPHHLFCRSEPREIATLAA